MIKWLRRQHELWHSTRIITLVGGGAGLIYAIFSMIQGELNSGTLALLGIAGYCLSYTLGSWTGRPEISLLLKLVDAQGRDSEPVVSTER